MIMIFASATQADSKFHIMASNDYVIQGISQTRGKELLQAGVSYANNNGFFTGIWIAENSFIPRLYYDNRTLREIDYYAGYEWLTDQQHTWTLLLTHYSYPSNEFSNYRYNELSLSTTLSAGLSATIGINDNLFGRNELSRYYELTFERAISGHTLFNAGLGYNDIDALPYRYGRHYDNYGYWNIGLSQLAGRFMFDLGYIGTENAAKEQFGTQAAGSRWVFSIATGF